MFDMKSYVCVPAVAAATMAVAAYGSSSKSGGSPTTGTTPSSDSGASSSPTASAQQSPTPSAQPVDPLQYVLSISDLPTGWSAGPFHSSASSSPSPSPSPSSSELTSCYYNVLNHAPRLSFARTSFTGDGTDALLQNLIASYQSGSTAWNTVKANLDNCTSFSEEIGGETLTGTMEPMPFLTYGDQSAAYTANMGSGGYSFVQSYVIVRKGNWIALIALGDYPSVEMALLTTFVEKAVAKMPG
jgi:hypothetical protein